jgi:hypothetical protein
LGQVKSADGSQFALGFDKGMGHFDPHTEIGTCLKNLPEVKSDGEGLQMPPGRKPGLGE